MANEENLVSLADRTKKEQREIARMGGKASGEARRQKKLILEALLYMITSGEYEIDIKGQKIKVDPKKFNEGLVRGAIMGNSRSWEMIMNYLIGKPKESIEHSGEIKGTMNIVVGDIKLDKDGSDN